MSPHQPESITTAAFYDLKAEQTLARRSPAYGAASQRAALVEPYLEMERLLAAERSHLSGDATLLDLCCGVGWHSVAAAKLGYQVTGVDLSPRSIAHAEWLARVNGVSELCQFEVGDARQFQRDAYYAVVISSGSLYYFGAQSAADLVLGFLRPGGLLICVETSGRNRLISAYRRVRWRQRRDRDSFSVFSLWARPEINTFAQRFAQPRIRYFDVFTLAGDALSRWPGLQGRFHLLAKRVDRLLLDSWAPAGFKFVLTGRRPVPWDPATKAGIVTRAMKPADLDDVLRVCLAASSPTFSFGFGPKYLRTLFSTYVEDPAGAGFVGEVDGTVVGYVVGTRSVASHYQTWLRHHLFDAAGVLISRRVLNRAVMRGLARRSRVVAAALIRKPGSSSGAILANVAVDPSARRRGIGEALVATFTRAMADKGCERVILDVREDNQPARRLYERLGWVAISARTNPEGERMLRYQTVPLRRNA